MVALASYGKANIFDREFDSLGWFTFPKSFGCLRQKMIKSIKNVTNIGVFENTPQNLTNQV